MSRSVNNTKGKSKKFFSVNVKQNIKNKLLLRGSIIFGIGCFGPRSGFNNFIGMCHHLLPEFAVRGSRCGRQERHRDYDYDSKVTKTLPGPLVTGEGTSEGFRLCYREEQGNLVSVVKNS